MSTARSRFDVLGQLGALRRYARSLTRNSPDAEDLVQDTLVRAFERRSTFQSQGNIRPWLLSILHNVFIDRARSRRAEDARLQQAAELQPMTTQAPQDHAVRLRQIRDVFMRLPEDQRAALHLVAIEGLSYQDAAETLGIPTGTLMSRIGRARATLRALEDRDTINQPLRIVGGRDDHDR